MAAQACARAVDARQTWLWERRATDDAERGGDGDRGVARAMTSGRMAQMEAAACGNGERPTAQREVAP